MSRRRGATPAEDLATEPRELAGVRYTAAAWDPPALERLVSELAETGAAALATVDDRALLDAWGQTVETFLDPGSEERRRLDPALASLCRLSEAGLGAALEAVLGGVRRGPAERLLAEAPPRAVGAAATPSPVVVFLASNLPALAVQPLLPALLRRRPVLLKSPSAEPLFAPAFAAALAGHEPRLGEAVAAITWRGGDAELEAPLLAGAGKILAYGNETGLADLERRCPGRLVAYGPRTSLAALGAEVPPRAVAPGLARDVALFDQRGCLSIQAVYTTGDAHELADALAEELRSLARRWPAGPATLGELAAVQQVRQEADLRGLYRPPLALDAGTVVVEPEPTFLASPGRRTVRIHPLPRLHNLPAILAPWIGRLQGAALAGTEALALRSALGSLGLSRLTAPGELQSPDISWHNGGRHPLEALG
ncbi:MAG: hypothetical protein KDD11_01070 [Acidobacteria bacterium]|nr:hypothetical protein [Acidobacteriota bacterium]